MKTSEQPNLRLVFGGLLLVMLLAALDQTIVATALPTIVGDLGGLDHISWVVTAYLLAQTAVTPLYGKLGDMYGRKVVLQAGLIVFLVGSALCGQSQSLDELIAFRALQGLGGGGLMVSAQAAIGDVVPPRERGRYTGLFGAVFGLASIAGPLLGGFLTSDFSWRWIFYVNLPLGILAFFVLAATLPSVTERVHHVVDYLGTALLAAGLTAIVLAASLGGTSYAWGSPFIVSLAIAGVLLLAAFAFAERRAAEPVLPPRLLTNRVFVVTGAVGFVVGFALFGAVTYLPLFLQVVKGATPTGSGLQLLPLMGGLLITSILSGQLITRTGRYKPFPIAGTAVMTVGLYLLSTMYAVELAGLDLAVHVHPRAGSGDGHAGPDPRRAERGRLLRPRGRDLGRHAVSLDRRVAGHRGARRDLRQPADQRAEERLSSRRRRPRHYRKPGQPAGDREAAVAAAPRLSACLHQRAQHRLPRRIRVRDRSRSRSPGSSASCRCARPSRAPTWPIPSPARVAQTRWLW